MKQEDMIALVKEVGSDVQIYQDFLAKLCGYIYITSNATKFKTQIETQYKNMRIVCKLSYGAFGVKK
jgi:hypothetical protein